MAKSGRFELRLDEDILNRIDRWRSQQADVPTRAEAMRRLADAGLARSSPEARTFRPADRLIIAMLGDLFKRLKVKGEINADLVLSALYGGHYWALDWEADGMPTHLFHGHEDKKEDVSFVVNVLDMWYLIETSYQGLPKKERDRIAAEVNGPFGTNVNFSGFDSHCESSFIHIARFMIEKLGYFQSTFGGRDLDSHIPRAAEHQRMYRVFEPIRPTLMGAAPLKTDQMIEILKAAKQPKAGRS